MISSAHKKFDRSFYIIVTRQRLRVVPVFPSEEAYLVVRSLEIIQAAETRVIGTLE